MDPEAGTCQPILIIKRAAFKLGGACGIHKDPRAQVRDDLVPGLPGTDGHGVLESGATSFFNSQTEPLSCGFVPDEVEKSTGCGIGHCDHVLFL